MRKTIKAWAVLEDKELLYSLTSRRLSIFETREAARYSNEAGQNKRKICRVTITIE